MRGELVPLPHDVEGGRRALERARLLSHQMRRAPGCGTCWFYREVVRHGGVTKMCAHPAFSTMIADFTGVKLDFKPAYECQEVRAEHSICGPAGLLYMPAFSRRERLWRAVRRMARRVRQWEPTEGQAICLMIAVTVTVGTLMVWGMTWVASL